MLDRIHQLRHLVLGFFFIRKDRSISSMLLSKSSVSLLIVCHDNLSTIEREVLKYPTIIVLVSISFFSSINVCLIYLGTMMLSTYIYNCYVLLMKWLLLDYIMTFFVSWDSFWLKVHFVWKKYSYSCPLLVTICMDYPVFIPLTFSLCVSLKLKWISCEQYTIGFFF